MPRKHPERLQKQVRMAHENQIDELPPGRVLSVNLTEGVGVE